MITLKNVKKVFDKFLKNDSSFIIMNKCLHKECDCGIFSMDSKTPFRVHLSAYYKRSFAFYTLKERMPVILTKLIDFLVRDKEYITEHFGEEARNELKTVIGEISKLKYEIVTNKPIPPLDSSEPDAKLYNQYLMEQNSEGTARFFTSIWLHAECFMYRKVKSAFENTNSLKHYDYFLKLKQNAFNQSISAIISLAEYLLPVLKEGGRFDVKDEFMKLLKMNLWGNRCDLSISAGDDNCVAGDPLNFIIKYEKCVLSDHSEQIWWALNEPSIKEPRIIEFVTDNAGYEIFTDLCLADFIISHNLADKIIFNLKSMPWFISDCTSCDIKWMIRILINNENSVLKKFGIRWNKYIRENVWSYTTDPFWTLPVDFTRMEKYAPELYSRLSEAVMIIFKGDLNYRKLFGEINWEPSTPVTDALQGFQPTKLCTLRTVKADIICGLAKGVAQMLDDKDPAWMTTGNYGVIQFSG